MKSLHKLVSLTLAASMVLSLTACKSGGGNTDPPAGVAETAAYILLPLPPRRM